MHVVVVSDEVPNPQGTDTNVPFLILNALKERGHQVTALLPLPHKSMIVDSFTQEEWRKDLESSGIPVSEIRLTPHEDDSHAQPFRQGLRKLRKTFAPSVEDYFPNSRLAPMMQNAIADLDPDVVCVWGTPQTVALLYGVHGVPRLALVGDPPHFVMSARTRPPFSSRWAFSQLQWWSVRLWCWGGAPATISLLNDFDLVMNTAAHHTRWLRSKGIQCDRMLPLATDWGGPGWASRRRFAKRGGRYKITLLGNVQSTVNHAGLDFFGRDILPELLRMMPGKFEVHIFGRGELGPHLRKLLSDPSVKRRGFVEDIVSELLSTDIVVVPTPISLGARWRLANVWSVGCPVVVHKANLAGLPEIEDGRNALVASSGAGLAQAIVRICGDKDLRWQLARGGRETYEGTLALDRSMELVISRLHTLGD